MRNWGRKMAMVLLASLLTVTAWAGGNDTPTMPMTAGHKWRIAYYQGGPNDNYHRYLVATVKGLMKLGWIETQEIPRQRVRDSDMLWRWLVKEVKSDYLEFVEDAYYSAEWDERVRERTREVIIKRLSRRSDIDLIIAMGTWAGKDLANNQHSTPTVIMSTSDPVRSEIIKGFGDSGFDHVHARVDPLRYQRQIEVFHDIIGFERLGIAYEDSVAGRSYAAIDTVEKVAAERGFTVVRCHTQSDIADQVQAGLSVINCFRSLVKEVDAIYVTVQGGVNNESLPELVRLTIQNRVPTFSQLGSPEVENGLLLSISRAGGFAPVGMFMAETVAKILNGAKPRDLDQIFEDAPNIAINLKTAELVGLYLYADILAAADEIYREISIPETD